MMWPSASFATKTDIPAILAGIATATGHSYQTSSGVAITLIGVGAGFVLALMIGKLLSGFLYEVHAVEPLVLFTAPLILTAVSLLACYIPARRAARVDPMTALRYE